MKLLTMIGVACVPFAGASAAALPVVMKTTTSSDTWTVMVYMCGSNLESQWGMATGNIKEMINATTGSNLKIVLETGGSSSWSMDNPTINANKIQRWEITNGSMTLVDTLAKADMGNEATLQDFLTWGASNYKTTHYMADLWDHGGACWGACQDENYSDMLSIYDMQSAFSKAAAMLPSNKFDIIDYDCCLMSNLETLTLLAPYTSYFTVSEESEPGSGQEYTNMLSNISANPSNVLNICKNIVDTYSTKQENEAKQNNYPDAHTLAVIDSSKIANVETALQSLISSSINGTTFKNAGNGAQQFAVENNESYNVIDLGDLANRLKTSEASTLLQTIKDATLYQDVCSAYSKTANGINIYYPITPNEYGMSLSNYVTLVSKHEMKYYATYLNSIY